MKAVIQAVFPWKAIGLDTCSGKKSDTGTLIMMLVLIAYLPLVLGTSPSPPRTTGNIVATVVVGAEPNEIVYNPSNNKVYVSHAGTGYDSRGNVSGIDALTIRVV